MMCSAVGATHPGTAHGFADLLFILRCGHISEISRAKKIHCPFISNSVVIYEAPPTHKSLSNRRFADVTAPLHNISVHQLSANIRDLYLSLLKF